MSLEVRPGYKQTEAGVIPEDWSPYTIGDLMDFEGGSQPDKSVFRPSWKPGYIRLIQIRDYKTDKYETYIPLSLARRFCNESDIMIGRYGPPIFQILRGIVGAYNVALIKVKPCTGINNSYAYYFLKQEKLFAFIEKLSQRSSGQTGVDLKELRQYPLPLPSIDEQKAIAEALSDTDSLIESLEHLLAKKRNLKQGTMQELLTGKKRLPEFSGKWDLARLDELGAWKGGMTPSMQNVSYWQGGTMPWISSGDVKAARLTATSFSVTGYAIKQGATTLIPANSIVVVARSGILRKYLPVAMNMLPMAINQDIKALVPNSRIDANYLLHALIGHGDEILARCMKLGTTVESIEFPWMKAFTIPLPPIPEQSAISAVLSDMDSEIADLEAQLTKIRALKQGMMHKLLTGEIRLL